MNQNNDPIKEDAGAPPATPSGSPAMDPGPENPPENQESHPSLSSPPSAEPKNILNEARKDLDKAREDFEEEEREIESAEEPDAAEIFQILAPQGVPGIVFEEVSVTGWCERLQKHRLLILESWDPSVLYAAAQSIAFHSSWGEMDCRYVEVTDSSGDLKLKSIAQAGVSPQKRERLIMIHEVISHGASIVHNNPYTLPSLKNFRDLLKKNHLRLLIVVFSELLRKREPDYNNLLFTECKQDVDFLLPRLKALYGPEAPMYQETILEQREEGLWSKDDQEFQEELIAAIGRGTLKTELTLRDERCRQIEQQKKIDPVNSLPGMTSLECASVWIATFMPRLPVRDFEQVQQILLEGAKPGTIEHHAIWDGWEKNANEILEKCQMAIQEMPRQSPCVGFQRSALAAAYQRGFLEKLRFQHEKFFDRIERNRLLLSNRDSLQRAAAGLLAQRCLQEIDDFTIPLLIRTIEFLTAPAKTASYADDLMEHIPVEQKHAIQRALAHLLQRLVQEGGADIATRMVLALAGTGGLRTAFEIFKESRPEEFRSEHLLRVMAVFLQRGKEKLPERARQLLLKVISRKPERMGEILSLMRGLLTEAIAVDWLAFACERHIKGTRSQERDPILRLVLAGEHADGRLGSFFELLANTAFEAAVTSLQPFSVNSERLDALSYWLFPYRELSRLELDPALIYLGAQLSARNVFWQRIRKMPQKYMPSQSDLFLTILAANWSYEAELAGTENSSTHEFLDKLRRIRDGQLAGMNAAAMILSEMLGEALAAGLSSLPSDKAAYAVKTRMSDRWKGLRRGMQAVRGILGARKSKT